MYQKRKLNTNYFIVQIEDDQEIMAYKNIKKAFPDLEVTMPVERVNKIMKGKKFVFYDRCLPGYLVLSSEEELSLDKIKSIEKIPLVVKLLDKVEHKEIKKFLIKDCPDLSILEKQWKQYMTEM